MITMTYAKTNGRFVQAMQKLTNLPLPTKAAYTVKKIADAISREKKTIALAFEKDILTNFAKRDEKGEIVRDEDGQPTVDETKQVEFMKAQEEFGKREFTIDRQKLSLEVLASQNQLSASDLSALDPILEDPETVVENVATVTAIK